MRDTDRDLTSVIVVREDSSREATGDLKGAAVSVGAIDSPQATLIPLGHFMTRGLRPDDDFRVVYQDVRGGKHGDHGAAERAAARALVAGEVDAACLLGGNQILFAAEGVIPDGAVRVIGETERFDHCNFTVGPHAADAATERFHSLLSEMRYEDPEVRPLFDLEGLRAWVDGRTEGYEPLESAVDELGFYDSAGAITLEAYRY
jgi:ABC-type phosphate/phosphonate transport system substrate-binding protein